MKIKCKSAFSKDGAFVSATSQLPDILTQNGTKVYQKGHEIANYLAKRLDLETLTIFSWVLEKTDVNAKRFSYFAKKRDSNETNIESVFAN